MPPRDAPQDAPRLVARFLDDEAESGFQDIDLTHWLDRPQIAHALHGYFLASTALWNGHTRDTQVKHFKVFKAFLDEQWNHARGLGDITSRLVFVFEGWLDDQRTAGSPEDDIEAGLWTGLTKIRRYGAVVQFLDHCWRTRSLRQYMVPNLAFRRNPWPRAHHDLSSHKPLTREELQSVRKACLTDIGETKRRLRLGAKARADSRIAIPPLGERSPKPYVNELVRLRTLSERHDDRVPSREEIASIDPGLSRSITPPNGTQYEVGSHLHFTARSILPFAILLAMETAFNPDTILDLAWGDISREHALYGEERWRIAACKDRSGGRQHRSFASRVTDEGSPVQLLKFVEEFGAPTRARLPPHLRDRVFAFWQVRGSPFNIFSGPTSSAECDAWRRSLKKFREDYGLPYFSLVTLRATAGDLIDEVVGGDIKAKQHFLGHAQLSTTAGHYHSETAKRRGREALAVEMDLRERYASTNGRADPRTDEAKVLGRSAATPGFRCAEPLFSPVPGQKEGRACAAYAACPTCEHAIVDLDEPLAHRRLTQLRDRLEQARKDVHPERWIDVWQPQLAALETHWLPSFKGDVPERASALDVRPIPRIE